MITLKDIEHIKSALRWAYKSEYRRQQAPPSRGQIIQRARSRFGTNLVTYNKLTNTIFKDQEMVILMNLVLDDIIGTSDPTNDLLKIRALLSTATGFISRNNTVLSDLDIIQTKAAKRLEHETLIESTT